MRADHTHWLGVSEKRLFGFRCHPRSPRPPVNPSTPCGFVIYPQFYLHLVRGGYEGVRNWGRHSGFSMMQYARVLVHLHRHGNHWTLVIVSTEIGSLTHYDPGRIRLYGWQGSVYASSVGGAFCTRDPRQKVLQLFDVASWSLHCAD